jgi:ubiquinone/menaquinone biosynthesis C-methylase UbiE
MVESTPVETRYEAVRYTTTEDWNAKRSLATSAGFFAPHIRPGMRLLDCGCGPGSITLDLAEAVAPGEVIGLDLHEDVLKRARATAEERDVKNVRFEQGDLYDLQHPDASFDAIWTSAVLQWLDKPRAALREVYRVLKPGGVYATRDRDRRGDIFGNRNRLVKRALELHYRQNEHWSGGDLSIGGKMRTMLLKAGFENVQTVASYETEEGIFAAGGYVRALKPEVRPQSVQIIKEKGWANDADLARMIEAWEVWGEDPRSYYCLARVENVAWKPKDT